MLSFKPFRILERKVLQKFATYATGIKKSISDIPGPGPSLPYIGTSWIYSSFGSYSFHCMHEAAEEFYKQYGPIYKEDFGRTPLVSIFKEEDIEKVFHHQGKYPMRAGHEVIVYRRSRDKTTYNTPGLVESSGEEWLQLRRKVNPVMSNINALNKNLKSLSEVADDLMDQLAKVSKPDGEVCDVAKYLTLFGLEATEDGTKAEPISLMEHFLRQDDMDPRDANTIAVDFMTAGIPLISYFLTLLLHRLGKEKRVREILQEELQRVLKASRGPITPDMINKLPYLKAVVQEGYRITTIVPGIMRILSTEIELSGYRIPPYTPILCHNRIASKQEENFSRALEFIPERWIGNQFLDKYCSDPEMVKMNKEVSQSRFLVLPFGFGARMCVGKRLTELKIHVLLAKLLRRYDIESLNELKVNMMLVITPAHSLSLYLREME